MQKSLAAVDFPLTRKHGALEWRIRGLCHAQVTVGGIILVALVATSLPVPMAFDVVIAYVAMTRGVPLPYVVTILCTLGIISVYSLIIVGKSLSWKAAAAAYATVAALGATAGMLARLLP